MNKIFYIISLVLLSTWFIGYVAFNAFGGLIHILFWLAIISILLSIIFKGRL